MKKIGTSLFYFYQRAFWYIAQAKNEALKPLGFWNETILLLTFLAVRGINPTPSQIFFGYIVLCLIGALVGKLIVWMGIVKYNTRIANRENPELQAILRELGELKEMVKNKSSISNFYSKDPFERLVLLNGWACACTSNDEKCLICGNKMTQEELKKAREKILYQHVTGKILH